MINGRAQSTRGRSALHLRALGAKGAFGALETSRYGGTLKFPARLFVLSALYFGICEYATAPDG